MKLARSLLWTSSVLGIAVTAVAGSAEGIVAQSAQVSESAANVSTAAPVDRRIDAVEGSWRAEEYVLASGPVHPLRGHIMFAGGDWNVLFFVLDAAGTPVRMSAEGGTYTLFGEDLVFTHLYFAAKGDAVAGLPEAPFEMRALDGGGAEEPSTIAINGDLMTLFFPSGNEMRFARAPEAG